MLLANASELPCELPRKILHTLPYAVSYEGLDAGTLKHLVKQGGFLLKLHQAELTKDPTSHVTESSCSNLMALGHTVKRLYGSAVAIDVADLVTMTEYERSES